MWNRGGGELHRKNCIIKYENIITFENLLEAWGGFSSGKRNREDVNDFANNLSDNLFDILYDLKSEVYKHGGYEEYIICDTKKRVIHKASIRDRVVHRLIYNALYSYFDKRFIYDSYSSRIGKGTHKAQARFRSFVNIISKNYTKPCFILKFDIKKCFQNIDTEILKNIIDWNIEDLKLKKLIFIVIDSFKNGLSLGNLTSQLFINIYLNELDLYAKNTLKCRYYIRYADDIIIVFDNKEELEKLYVKLEVFLKEELKLITHKKTINSIYFGIDILGLVYFSKYERLRRSTERRKIKRESKLML